MMSFGNTVLVAKNKSETTKQMKGGSGASHTHTHLCTPLYTSIDVMVFILYKLNILNFQNTSLGVNYKLSS